MDSMKLQEWGMFLVLAGAACVALAVALAMLWKWI